MRLYKPFSNRLQYPSDTPPCQQCCGRQTLPITPAYLSNNPQPISVPSGKSFLDSFEIELRTQRTNLIGFVRGRKWTMQSGRLTPRISCEAAKYARTLSMTTYPRCRRLLRLANLCRRLVSFILLFAGLPHHRVPFLYARYASPNACSNTRSSRPVCHTCFVVGNSMIDTGRGLFARQDEPTCTIGCGRAWRPGALAAADASLCPSSPRPQP